jgi:Tol biopolymer transport system component
MRDRLQQPVGGRAQTANAEIKLIPAAGGEAQVLTASLDARVTDHRWAPDGRSVLFLVPERGRIDLRRVPVHGGSAESLLTAEREMLAYDLAPDGQRVGFVASTDRAPWDLYVANLDGSAEQRLTQVNTPWLSRKTLGEVEDL